MKKKTKNEMGIQPRAKSSDLGDDVCAAEDFVSVSACEHGEVADGSAEGSVSDAVEVEEMPL